MKIKLFVAGIVLNFALLVSSTSQADHLHVVGSPLLSGGVMVAQAPMMVHQPYMYALRTYPSSLFLHYPNVNIPYMGKYNGYLHYGPGAPYTVRVEGLYTTQLTPVSSVYWPAYRFSTY